MKNNSDKKRGLIAIAVYHLIAAVLFLVMDSGGLNNLKLPNAVKGLISVAVLFVVAGISFLITLVLKKKNNLKPTWVLLNFAITLMQIFGVASITAVAPQFYNNTIGTFVYFLLLFMTCYASLNGYMKKKTVNPYRNAHGRVDKPIHTQIYEEYGNFGD